MKKNNLQIEAEAIWKNSIQKTLDSMPKQVAVLDNNAKIVAVNMAWKLFADQNDLCSPNYCVGENYIEICKKALEERSRFIEQNNLSSFVQKQKEREEELNSQNLNRVIISSDTEDEQCHNITDECKDRLTWEITHNGVMEQTEGAYDSLKAIEQIIAGEIETFSIDYPCHSPDEKRWFKMTLLRFTFQDNLWILVSHENITQSKLAEINLIKSENKLKGIIQSIPDAMCMIDRSQNIIWVNDIAKKLYGPSLVGKKCYRAYGRWNNLCQNCIVHKTFRDGKVHSEEYAHFDVDGNERIILCTSSVAGCDELGDISHVMEIMRDITEKRRDENFLKFMQVAVDTTGDGVYWITPDGSFRYVNKSVLQYTGYTQQEFTTLKIYNIDPNITESSWKEHWNSLRQYKTMRFETIHRTKYGFDIPFEVTANHVIFDRGDEYNFAVVRNISERKQAEREIRRLSQAVEHSPVSVVITDTNGNIEYVNLKFTQVTGYSREEAVGQNPRILSSGQMPIGYYKNLWQTILSGEEWKGEFINKKKSGEIYWESASISPVVDANGKIAYFVAIKEDTTNRKKIMEELKSAKKKAESATRAKSEFLATMSHEIRTPMNAIMGMSHLMMDTELSDTQYGYLSNIQSAADSLLTIINDILDLSKIEAGKMEFESVEFEWHQIIEKIFNVLKFTANEKKLELIYSFGKNIPQVMVGDPTRLSQVIMNLVGNAVKYTPSGEVWVHTELVSLPESKENIVLRVSIKDTGIGISDSNLSSLFTPFTQADSSTTRKYGGTGLGLVIAKRLVNKMGGDIEVQSVPGKGSTFSFTVVLNRAAKYRGVESDSVKKETIAIATNLSNQIDSSKLSGLNVMVVEPNISSRRALTTTLKSLNMRVMAASNGDEAIQLMGLVSERISPPEKRLSEHRISECPNSTFRDANSNKPAFDLVLINSNLPTDSINCVDTIKSLESIVCGSKSRNSTVSAQVDLNRPFWDSPDKNTLKNANKTLKTKYIVIYNFTEAKEAERIAKQVHVDTFLSKPLTPALFIRTILNVISLRDETYLNEKQGKSSSGSVNNKIGEKEKEIVIPQKMLQQDRVKQISAKSIQDKFKERNLTINNKHILVVDDDEINRQIVVAMVKKAGVENVSVAMNGEEAVLMAQKISFDMILMDIEMPIMDGLEATRKIRELGVTAKDSTGTARDIPIIALTGHALDEYREKCFKAGMNTHIDKPIQPEKLYFALEKWLI